MVFNMMTTDAAEGIAAFMQKRLRLWQGKSVGNLRPHFPDTGTSGIAAKMLRCRDYFWHNLQLIQRIIMKQSDTHRCLVTSDGI